MEIDVGHIPGHDNFIADDLSRWDGMAPIPHSFVQADRVRFSLQDLWVAQVKPSFTPPDISLPWSLPNWFTCWKSLSTILGYGSSIGISTDS